MIKINASARLHAAASDSLKQAAADMRDFMKHNGIKARLKTWPPNNFVISAPAFNVKFDEDAQRKIRTEAKRLGLTWVRKLPIDVNQMTNPDDFHLYLG